jgi:hypothetical protein
MSERLKTFFKDKARKRRILALDGGGVRGFLTLGVLNELEKELVRRSGDPDYRLSQYFDLIGGTSTGSIIATGLALGWKVERVWDAYVKIVPRVFVSRWASMGIIEPLYDQKPLMKALEEEFGQEQLCSEELETGLAIFAKSMSTGSAWEWCNNPDWIYYDAAHGNASPNKYFELRSIVQASAAAPHYFKGVNIEIAVGKNEKERHGYFIDGGVGGFNNPALELLTMIRDPAYGFEWPLGADDLYLFSVGTGWVREKSRFLADKLADFLFILQTVKALQGMINDVSLQHIAYLQAMSRVAMPWYINAEKRYQGFDGVDPKPYLTLNGAPLLTYQRVDVRLDSHDGFVGPDGKFQPLPETAKALLEESARERETNPDGAKEPKRKAKISNSEFKGMLRIDNAKQKNSDLLSQLGRAAGRRAMRLAPPPDVFDIGPKGDAAAWRRPEGFGKLRNAATVTEAAKP